ncbi:hypothetical protein Bealeia2_02078 (plasmid) [Candidatus Bealeia paramacronuclearis]|nr:hypothetical protein [Candidatus Bealeia paramacronuclearis]
MRRSFHRLNLDAIIHDTGFEETTYQFEDFLVLDFAGQTAHKPIMVDVVEEGFQVNVYHPDLAILHILTGLLDSLMGRSARPKAIA